MEVTVTGAVLYWRGPAPFHFVTVPPEPAEVIAATSELVTYGWGMIPVTITLGATTWTTSLWPKDGAYLVPLKAEVRRAESVAIDDIVTLRLRIGM